MNVYFPPDQLPPQGRALFLAGTIDMGASDDWQAQVVGALADTDWQVFNPRRSSWDPNWIQGKDMPQFREQVIWELDALERADTILLYFAPGSRSPVSLLELGLFAHVGKLLVVCPEGYWRKGNVDIVCERYGISQATSLEDALLTLKGK